MDMNSTIERLERVISLQQELQVARWTSDNSNIVAFEKAPVSVNLDAKLLQRYELPSDINAIINTETVNNELNANNYRHHMHSLLTLEEFIRMKIISR